MEVLLDAHQLTSMLGVSKRTLESIIDKNEAPSFILIGRQRRWRPSDVEAWFEARLIERATGKLAVEKNEKGDGSTE